jgi:hypothetical protein
MLITAKYGTTITQDISGGYAALFNRNIAEAGSNPLVQIVNDHTSDTAGALKIQQDGAGKALAIDMNGNHRAIHIETDSTTISAFQLEASSLTTGDGAYFYSGASNTSTRNLVHIHNDHASATGTTALKIVQDSPAGTAGVGLALNIQGVNAEVLVGNTGSALEQAVHIGLSKRQNYGNVILSKNLKGVSGADTYKTIGTHGAVGYAAMEFDYGGVTRFSNFSGATTADAVVTPSEKMRITSDGRVGIGSAAPSVALDVVGEIKSTGNQSRLVGVSFYNGNNDGNQVTLENNKTYDGIAISLGTAGGSGSEDLLYSQFVVDGTGSVTKTDKVSGSGFRWIVGTNYVYVDEYQSYQGPHWGMVFERGATFDNS